MRTKSPSKRREIVDVASTVFMELGFDQASMSEIASRVGGSKATLYNYFSSKEELFAECIRANAAKHFEPIFAHLPLDADLPEMLERFGNEYVQTIIRPEIMQGRRLVQSSAGNSQVGLIYYENGPRIGWSRMAEVLRNAMDNGVLEPSDPWVAALHLKALLEAEFHEQAMLALEPAIDPSLIGPAVRRAVAFFLKGYRPQT
ncbi:TetR/AcrR family transcriptional regulator [Pseudomonas luteola]|uniref:TetR/AcrR family transcriptional regulator n=1 Tax=Pseudomonas luteola TaxID=47886 RepID=A0ABS0MY93_PSELU|nr:TetR/AcrR family transcriptional regulator [Pseudomonas luteola]MBH3441689.1 TetR/AcrR family transcriptional regulator [Pseudomonas luteola]